MTRLPLKCRVSWSSWWMVWARLGVSPGVSTHGGSAWGLQLEWQWLSLSPFAQGDLLFLLLRVGPQGHWWWFSPRHTMLGDRGWGCKGSPLQMFQSPLEMQVDGHSNVIGRLNGISWRVGLHQCGSGNLSGGCHALGLCTMEIHL